MTQPAIYNLGSINVDHVYTVERLVQPGETIKATGLRTVLGGKGLNVTVALQRQGASVTHIGAVGRGDDTVRAMLGALDVDGGRIADVDAPTGHAIICLDETSENSIVIFGGANAAITDAMVADALADAQPGDWLVMQNETNANRAGVELAREKAMNIALVAAPFDADQLTGLISQCDLVTMNTTELAAFEAATGQSIGNVAGPDFLITHGRHGSEYIGGDAPIRCGAYAVEAVDTVAAGDTYFGAFLAHRARGRSIGDAMTMASAAAALKVQRPGSAVAIPDLADTEAFVATNGTPGNMEDGA